MKTLMYITSILAAICLFIAVGIIATSFVKIFGGTIDVDKLDTATNLVVLFGATFFVFFMISKEIEKGIIDK